MYEKPLVIIGILGSTLDSGKKPRRMERWRPTIACISQPDMPVSRFELLYHPEHEILRRQVSYDMQDIAPEMTLNHHKLTVSDPWDFESVYGALYSFTRSYAFKPDEEEYLVHITTGTHVAQICLFLLTESRRIPGRLLQTGPKIRVDPGPERARGRYDIVDLDLSKYDQLAARFAGEQQAGVALLTDGIPTHNADFAKQLRRIEQVSQASTAPILLTGPTGAGKTRLARRIFQLKKSKHLVDGHFVEVNCATLRGDAAMSTLFGHIKGAFTGAMTDRKGLLHEADGGLLFLDEIGELGLDEQAMLLRAIEDHTFRPVGSDHLILSDFQLVAGTNRDLTQQVKEGTFREDLLARINLWHFPLPGLSERREDIEPNIVYELERFASEQGRKVIFNRDAWQHYLHFAIHIAAWPGNFRDLAGSIIRLCTLSGDGRVSLDLVKEECLVLGKHGQHSNHQTLSNSFDQVKNGQLIDQVLGSEKAQTIDRFSRIQLGDVLSVCRDQPNLAAAGRILFSESRKSLNHANDSDRLAKYLAKFGIKWRKLKQRSMFLAYGPNELTGSHFGNLDNTIVIAKQIIILETLINEIVSY